MKSVGVALLALLVLAILSGIAEAQTDNTYVSNQSSRGINAILTCTCSRDFATVAFHVDPGTNQDDSYVLTDYNSGALVHIELWVDGAGSHNNVEVQLDQSIVAYDNADGSGVDIYLTKYGTINIAVPGVLVTIYP